MLSRNKRLENTQTGEVIKDLHVKIPERRYTQAKNVVSVLGKKVVTNLPFIPSAKPITDNDLELYLNKVWRPSLVVTGIDGLPPVHSAGNVLRPETTFRISFRLPPTLDSRQAIEVVKKLLTENPPYGAEINVSNTVNADGWDSPSSKKYLDDLLDQASKNFFGKQVLFSGEGGTIPFINMFAKRFPEAQFIVTGVLGPQSNAHGPNEFLHIPFTKKLLCCMVQVLGELTPHIGKN